MKTMKLSLENLITFTLLFTIFLLSTFTTHFIVTSFLQLIPKHHTPIHQNIS